MSDIPLTIDTSTLPKSYKRSTTDFDFVFQNPIRLESPLYNLIVLKLDTFYAINNINQNKFNNGSIEITYFAASDDVDQVHTITIPDGIYSFEDWKEEFDRQIDGLFRDVILSADASNDQLVEFTVNENTGKFTMHLNNDPNGDAFNVNTLEVAIPYTLAVMFGLFDLSAVSAPWQENKTTIVFAKSNASGILQSTYQSSFIPQWNMGILALHLECSLSSSSVSNGETRSVIASFNPRTVPFGRVSYEPENPVHMQINKRNLERITFRLTDQSGNIVELNEDMSILMVIRPFGFV